jgi:hypothetical protein
VFVEIIHEADFLAAETAEDFGDFLPRVLTAGRR